jgi:hypothetical protein
MLPTATSIMKRFLCQRLSIRGPLRNGIFLLQTMHRSLTQILHRKQVCPPDALRLGTILPQHVHRRFCLHNHGCRIDLCFLFGTGPLLVLGPPALPLLCALLRALAPLSLSLGAMVGFLRRASSGGTSGGTGGRAAPRRRGSKGRGGGILGGPSAFGFIDGAFCGRNVLGVCEEIWNTRKKSRRNFFKELKQSMKAKGVRKNTDTESSQR